MQVLCPYVGGGFGAKAELMMEAVAAIELAREVRAPVRLALDRAEEMAVGGYRPGVEIELHLAPRRDGAPGALSMIAHSDGGVAIGAAVASLCRLIYPGLDKELVDYDVASHGAPAKPFRGPGGPPAYWALEQAVDELAARKAEDPIALRRRVDPEPLREPLYRWIETLPAWRDRASHDTKKDHIRRGVGLAAATWPYFVQPNSTVEVSAGPGGVVVSSACQDIGTGSRTVLARAVAEVLGIDPKDVDVRLGDSRLAYGPVSNGSRTTASIRPAAREAAVKVRDALASFATRSSAFETPGPPRRRPPLGRSTPLGGRPRPSAPRSPPERHRQPTEGPRRVRAALQREGAPGRARLSGQRPPERGRGRHPTGKDPVTRVWGAYAVGTLAAPELARSQAYGGIVQGVGYALYEERVIDSKTGAVLSAGLDDYRITGVGDAPEIEVHFALGGFEHVQGGGVGPSASSPPSAWPPPLATPSSTRQASAPWSCRSARTGSWRGWVHLELPPHPRRSRGRNR